MTIDTQEILKRNPGVDVDLLQRAEAELSKCPPEAFASGYALEPALGGMERKQPARLLNRAQLTFMAGRAATAK